MKQNVAPLSGGVMIVGMFGFLIAVMFLKNYSLNWAFIVGTVSAIVFVASLISMTHAPIEDELLLDEHISDRRRRVKIYTLKEYKAHELLMKERHKRELEALKKSKPDSKKTVKKANKKKTLTKKKTAKKTKRKTKN